MVAEREPAADGGGGVLSPAGSPHAAAARLLSCPDPAALLRQAMSAGRPTAGIHAGILYVLQDDGWQRLAASEGVDQDALRPYTLIAPDAELPAATVVRERRSSYTLSEGPGSVSPRRDGGPPLVAYATFPLVADDRCMGTLTLLMRDAEPPTDSEHAELSGIATVCAHRLAHLLSRTEPPAVGNQVLDGAERVVQARSRATRLELSMSTAAIGSFDWDFATSRVVYDERMCRLFGLRPEEADQRVDTFLDAVHPADRAAVDDAVERAKETGICEVAHRILHPDGSVHWLDIRGRVFHDVDGSPQNMVGVAQDRTREYENEARKQDRKDFVMGVTRGFSAALSTQDVIDTMARSVLPAFRARGLAVYVQESGRIRLAGTRGFDDAARARLRAVGQAATGNRVFSRMRKGEPLFLEDRRQYAEAFPDPRMAPMADHHAWAMLPLVTPDGLVGTCVIIFDRPHRFSSDDRTVCTAVAGLLAQSLSRSQLFDERRTQLTELQGLLLPQNVADLPGLQLAVRYLPGSDGLMVGGDWYDSVPLPGGRSGLVIGDVQGHSARAAAVMGHLRSAMRAHAAEGYDLAGLMRRSNRTLCELDTDLFATCCLIEIDPSRNSFLLVRAGHPLPMLLAPDGTAHEVDSAGGLPLGCFLDAEYTVTEEALPPGATLLLYTDGLVETRGRDYADAVAGVRRRLARPDTADGPAAAHHDLDRLADLIVAPAASHTPHDDIALMLVRRDGGTTDTAAS